MTADTIRMGLVTLGILTKRKNQKLLFGSHLKMNQLEQRR